MFPAMESRVAEFIKAGTILRRIAVDMLAFQQGQRRCHLECRTGRIQTAQSFVDQRMIGIVVQAFPQVRRNAPAKDIGVIGRGGTKRIDRARLDIHQHSRGAFFITEAVIGIGLKFGVNGQADARTRHALITIEFPHLPAQDVHLNLCRSRPTLQRTVKCLFNAHLANFKSRQAEQRIVGHFRRVDRANITGDVCHGFAERVIPHFPFVNGDARQIGQMHLHQRHFIPAQVFADFNGQE